MPDLLTRCTHTREQHPRITWRYAEAVKLFSLLLLSTSLLATRCPAEAITLRISAQALQRTLEQQLFKGPEGRYYVHGHAEGGCFIYASNPQVSFREDRVVVHVKSRARLGSSIHGQCLGVGLAVDADVSMLPEAQGQNIGFGDARIENLSESHELGAFLEPFLNRKLPQELTVNAADLLRRLLSSSAQTTGYDITLQTLTIHSMQVQGDALIVNFDADLEVH